MLLDDGQNLEAWMLEHLAQAQSQTDNVSGNYKLICKNCRNSKYIS